MFAQLAYAEPASVTVWTKGSTRAARALFKPGHGVKILGEEEEMKRNREAGLLPVEQRNGIFEKAGVAKKIDERMDEMDKDMFMMALRDYKLSELREDYPLFSERELKIMKSEVEKAR